MTQAEIAIYRRNLENLYTLSEVDTRRVLQGVSQSPVPVAAGQLRELLPAIAETYGTAATIIAGEFFVQAQINAGVVSPVDYVAPNYDANLIVQSGVGYGVAQYTKGSSFEAVAGILAGTIQRAVAGYARETIYQNSEGIKTKYKRIARADACAFCAYAATWELTTSEDRKFHNDCHCVVVPEFEEIERPDYYDRFEEEIDAGIAQVRRDREIVEAAYRERFPGAKRRQFFASAEGSKVTLTTENYLREIRRVSGRR